MGRRLDLRGVNLSGAHHLMMGAHLEGASLEGAHLEGAILIATHLRGASLKGAHLEGAVLSGAIGLTEEQLKEAHGDAYTRLPKGVARPGPWPPEAPGLR